MATQIFKFKESIDTHSPDNFRMTPSFGERGVNGLMGADGQNGSTVFFANYDIDNSYYMDLAIQRISNNKMLSNTKNGSIPRPYMAGDIVITKSMMVYRITNGGSEKFALEYMGRITPTDALEGDNVNMVSARVSVSTGSDIGAVWNHIYMDSSYVASDDDMKRAALEMPYVTLTPELTYYGEGSIDQIMEQYDDIALEISLPNAKSLCGSAIPMDLPGCDPATQNLRNIIEINKVIEIPVSNGDGGWQSTKISISEGDSLHPSNNDIMGMVIDGIAKKVTASGAEPVWCTCPNPYSSNGEMIMYQSNESAAEAISGALDSSIYSDRATVMRSSYIKVGTPNFRPGESCFFSGSYRQTASMSYSDYVSSCNGSEKGTFGDMLVDYLTQKGNTYTLILTKKDSGTVRYIDVTKSIEFRRGI